MSTHTRPTAREHITQIAAAHGWTVTPEIAVGPSAVVDLIDRGDQVVTVTWVHEGRAATSIMTAKGDAELAPLSGARPLGLINLRALLEAEVVAA